MPILATVTPSMTAASILASLLAVDGAGSLLDADKLDGQEGAYYLALANATGTLAVANGGTGLASYTIGDLIYADGATSLAKLAGVATGNALISGGVATAPAWGKIGLTTHISGTLAEGNGGTNQTTYTAGDILYASALNTLGKLGIGAANTVLTSSGSAPQWSTSLTLAGAISCTSVTSSALTSGRVTYATTAGLLTDSAELTFSGTVLTLGTSSSLALSKTTGNTLTVSSTEDSGTATSNSIYTAGGFAAAKRIIAGTTLTVGSYASGDGVLVLHNLSQAAIDIRAGTLPSSGGRIGFCFSGGALSNTNRYAITAYATENWVESGASGTAFRFELADTGASSRTTAAILTATELAIQSSTTLSLAKTTGTTLTISSTDATAVSCSGGGVFSGNFSALRLYANSSSPSAASALFVKNIAGDTFVDGIIMQRNSSLDSWSFLIGGDNNYYFGYATNASGADAAGDFSAIAQMTTAGGLRMYGTSGTGLQIDSTDTSASVSLAGGQTIATGKNLRMGTAAVATTATDGFIYASTCAGTPTGTPTTLTGTAPIVIDTTNHKLYFYSGGSWRDAGP